MQCAHQSLNGMCVASCSSLSLCVGLFLGLALTRQSGAANSPSSSILSSSSSDMSSCSSPIPFNSFFPAAPILHNAAACQACRKRLDHSLSLPAENWTCFIEANPHVHRVHTIVHVQLDHRPISSVSNVQIPSIQHNSIPQLGRLFCIEMRGWTTFALLNVMHL